MLTAFYVLKPQSLHERDKPTSSIDFRRYTNSLDYDTPPLVAVIMTPEEERQAALDSYRQKLIESREWEAKLKNLRLEIKDLQKEFDRTEDNIKALQSVGQIIGEVLKQLDDERCMDSPAQPLCQTLPAKRNQSKTWNALTPWGIQLSSRLRQGLDMSLAADPRWTRRS